MQPRFLLVLALCWLALASKASAQEFADFSTEVNQAVGGDQQDFLNSLAEQGTPSNPFADAQQEPAYGLAPGLNATGSRLQYTGTGTVSYQDRSLTSSGSGCM
jgi:hypothetical protein